MTDHIFEPAARSFADAVAPADDALPTVRIAQWITRHGARKPTEADVRTASIRFIGIVRDFMMLNPVRETAAATAAMELAVHTLRKVFAQ
jgi:hypothetical protein